MNNDLIFRSILFATLVVVICVRFYYSRRPSQVDRSNPITRKEAIEREGRWSVLLRLFLLVCMLIFIVVYVINPPWLVLFSLSLPAWVRWLGAGLGVASIPLLVWVHHTLGKHWSTNLILGKEHTLVTDGPYHWVRHPMYTALFGFFVGEMLVSSNGLVAVLVVAGIAVLSARISKEEAMMIERFGDEYHAYQQRTGLLLPRLGRK